MIYDQFGREIPDHRFTFPGSGKCFAADISDRVYDDVSRNISPAKIDRIMSAANHGDASDQAELAALILEKNHSVADAFGVRCNAVLGLQWHIEPGDDTPEAEDAAKRFERELRSAGSRKGVDSFKSLLTDILKSLIVGYSVNEIVWGRGGSLLGFSSINAREIDFLNSFEPKIRTTSPGISIPLAENKFIFAWTRSHGNDPCRGGYIRPLAWLHCFSQCSIKDLLSFVERYGMPFVLAKVTEESFEKERGQLLNMIRNFGSGGGGLVTHGTDIQFVQAANTNGDIYFKILQYFDDAVHRLLLGQTASSGDGGGLSKDGAQDNVRQDILEADAAYLADVINTQLAAPWTRFNCVPGVALPRLVFDVAPPEDKEKLSQMVKTLFDSGLESDPEEMSEKFGIKLRKRETPPQERLMRDLSDSPKEFHVSPGTEKWLGPLAAHLEKLSSVTDPKEFGDILRDLARGDKTFGDSSAFQEELESAIWDGFCAGALAEDRILSAKSKRKR